MSDELKACSFCGEPGKVTHDGEHAWWWVECVACGNVGPYDLGQSGAVEAWNARPIEDALREQLAIAQADAALLRTVLSNLLTACVSADNDGDLSDWITGDLMAECSATLANPQEAQ
jgi:hypothetical protein